MKKTSKILEKFIGKNLEIEIDGEATNLCIVDWSEIVKESEEQFAKTEGMSEDEKNEFWNRASKGALAEIYEYFVVDSEFEQKVDDREWIPFGLLGLMHRAPEYGFAEMNNDGLLLFDITGGEEVDPEIILLVDGEERVIAESFDELLITEA